MTRWGLLAIRLGTCAAVVTASCSDDPGSGRNEGAQTGAPGTGGAGGAGPGVPTATGNTIFAANYGDEGQQSLGGIAADATGSVYTTGNESPRTIVTFSSTGQRIFGAIEGTANGVFVLKHDAAGTLLWRQPFSPPEGSFANLIGAAVQPTTGAVIIAGWLAGSVDTGGQTLTSTTNPQTAAPARNVWLTALDTAGYVVWSRIFPSPVDASPDRVFVTASGDIELVGSSLDNATVGGAPLCCRNLAFGTSTFVARYSPRGDPIWSEIVTGDFRLTGADGDAAGDLVLGGSLFGTMTFDGETLTGGGARGDGLVDTDAVVLRLDPQGHRVWSRLYAGPDYSLVGAAFDATADVILFGQFNGDLDLGNGQHLSFPVSNFLERAGLLAKLAPDGTAQWAHAFPANGFDTVEGRGAAGDAAGNIGLAGATAGGLDLGGGTPPLPAGTSGDFIAKFTSDGTFLWSRGFAVDTSNDASRRIPIVFDPSGDASVAGEFDNTVDFGKGPLTAPGQTSTGGSALPKVPDNVFVLKLAP